MSGKSATVTFTWAFLVNKQIIDQTQQRRWIETSPRKLHPSFVSPALVCCVCCVCVCLGFVFRISGNNFRLCGVYLKGPAGSCGDTAAQHHVYMGRGQPARLQAQRGLDRPQQGGPRSRVSRPRMSHRGCVSRSRRAGLRQEQWQRLHHPNHRGRRREESPRKTKWTSYVYIFIYFTWQLFTKLLLKRVIASDA